MKRHITQCGIWIAAVGMIALLSGCLGDDPTTSYTAKGMYRSGIRSVAIPMVQRGKDVYRRKLEFRLTETLVKRVNAIPNYTVLKRDQADTLLTCTIDRVNQATLSLNPDTGFPRDMELTIVVSYQWKDLRTGVVLAKRDKMEVARTYVPAGPMNQGFFQGSEDVINHIARRIVESMEVEWGTPNG